MKGLFVVFHGFSAHSGISKKIFAQCEALRHNGNDVALCYNRIEADGTQHRMVGECSIRTFGKGLYAKIAKRVSFDEITTYIRHEQIEFVYIRHDLNANPILIHWLRTIRKMNVRIALEIPTYPYDQEFKTSPWSSKLRLRLDQLCRHAMAQQVDRIVTFSDAEEIFGRPTIRISNGIDFRTIPLKAEPRDTSRDVHLLAVANIHRWHGFDRVIAGLHHYYANPRDRFVHLRIVGDGVEQLKTDYKRSTLAWGLENYITVCDAHAGAELDADFEWCDLGVASLARHRSGITTIKTLKNREYAARGVPFFYSEIDSDFDSMPYICKAPPDESPIDIEALLRWFDGIDRNPTAIRQSIEGNLSWEKQMQLVTDEIFHS